MQLDQWPPAELIAERNECALALPGVQARESRMASQDTLALYLDHEDARGPAEAFVDGLEFCYLHAMPEGGLHLTLPAEARQHGIETGWAEEHPSAAGGYLPKTLMLVYAPRDASELETVLEFVRLSYDFARG